MSLWFTLHPVYQENQDVWENPANHFTTWREPNGHPSIAGTGQASLDPEVDVISRPPPQNNRVTRWLGAGFKTPKPGLASGKSGRGLHKEKKHDSVSFWPLEYLSLRLSLTLGFVEIVYVTRFISPFKSKSGRLFLVWILFILSNVLESVLVRHRMYVSTTQAVKITSLWITCIDFTFETSIPISKSAFLNYINVLLLDLYLISLNSLVPFILHDRNKMSLCWFAMGIEIYSFLWISGMGIRIRTAPQSYKAI